MDVQSVLWIFLLSPLLATLMSLLPYQKLREGITLLSSALTAGASVLIIEAVKGGSVYTADGVLYADLYSAIVVFLVAFVYMFSAAYSAYHIRRVDELFLGKRYYYSLLNLFALTMFFTSLTPNLGLMWIGLEATTIVSALLITLERKVESIEAAWRYMIIASAGLGFALLSLGVIYFSSNTLNWYEIRLPPHTALLATTLALVGFGTKIGLFPMHTWLPDAHGSAPPSVSAMLSATLLPVAFLTYFRILSTAIASNSHIAANMTVFFGAATALIAAILMTPQEIIKRLLAYSSMDVMGIATVGIALGKEATLASFLLLVIHTFAKAGLFYAGGNVVMSYETDKIWEVSGLLNSIRLTGIALVLGALAVTGAPPFASFLAELVIISRSLSNPILTTTLFAAILLSFLSLNYHVTKMAFGRGKSRKLPLYAEAIPLLSTLVALAISFAVLGVLLG